MKKIYLVLIVSFVLCITSLEHKVFANYQDEDSNLIWKDINEKVYLDYDNQIHLTNKNTMLLVRSSMTLWEHDYGNLNPSDIIEIDLNTGMQVNELSFSDRVRVTFFELGNITYIAVLNEKAGLQVFNQDFQLVFEHINHNTSWNNLSYKEGILSISGWPKNTSAKQFIVGTFEEGKADQVESGIEEKSINLDGRHLLIGSTPDYDLTMENAEVIIDLSQLGSSEFWNLDNWLVLNDGFIFSVTNDAYERYIIRTNNSGQILKTYRSLSSFLKFNDYIIIQSPNQTYEVLDNNLEFVKSIPTENSLYSLGRVVDDETVLLLSKEGFDLYDAQFQSNFSYNGDGFNDDEIYFTEKYFYNYDKIVNRNTLSTAFYSPISRVKVIGDYALIIKMKFGGIGKGDSYGSARIYKIPKNATDNVVKVSSDKVWKITFSQNIDTTELQVVKNHFNVIQKTGEFSGYNSVIVDGRTVYVYPPKNGYKPGMYYLNIGDTLQNESGDYLAEEIFKPFIVE